MARGFPHEAKGTRPAATPGLTPLPPCEGIGAGMLIASAGSGLIFGRYSTSQGDLAEADCAPVPGFLRADVQAGRRVSANKMKRAATAVCGKLPVLRETGEACGGNFYFPELHPGGMTPWEQRRDVSQ
ncbi:hypothetical protein [Pseudogemmobacter humi]|uniref:Uncharacterized protein n=1 Tax=Pseudogemmobacter humi TaxID=2483812 RepID=A0A3P5XJB1_9RHOB|nr:hypothetical protein [Pseudogemmobacter humi]VDC31696.1 hypothetical protein XINFAN_03068 [Pseudogemmobacter humi]